jgi:hypothetical protein
VERQREEDDDGRKSRSGVQSGGKQVGVTLPPSVGALADEVVAVEVQTRSACRDRKGGSGRGGEGGEKRTAGKGKNNEQEEADDEPSRVLHCVGRRDVSGRVEAGFRGTRQLDS